MEYYKGRIYPNSSPEFRHLQKNDGTVEMQIRYINQPMNYISKWMLIQTEKENDNTSQSKA
jgi:hypothetical protein